MKKLAAAALTAGLLLTVGASQAGAAPADRGNCISTRDNGGAAGARISGAAGPGFGPFVAGYLGGGTLGSEARGSDCRP